MFVRYLKNNDNSKNNKFLKKVKIKLLNNNNDFYKIYCRLYIDSIEFNFKESFKNNKKLERNINKKKSYKSFSYSKISKKCKNKLFSLVKLIINDSNKEEPDSNCISKLSLCYDIYNILERLDNKRKSSDSNIINFHNTSIINQYREIKRIFLQNQIINFMFQMRV